MKKYLLSLVPFLALTANAVTYMCVKTDDGQVKKYKTDEVAKVEYADLENGVSVTGQIGDFTYVDLVGYLQCGGFCIYRAWQLFRLG